VRPPIDHSQPLGPSAGWVNLNVPHYALFTSGSQNGPGDSMKKLAVPGGITMIVLALILLSPTEVIGADCSKVTTGLIPLPELGRGLYQGHQGGLYPGGSNQAPGSYVSTGQAAARRIEPRSPSGGVDPHGKIVLMSIGMSNTTAEFSTFVIWAKQDLHRDSRVLLVDSAQGGAAAENWSSPSAPPWTVADQRLAAAGATEAQVQAIWLKQADPGPSGGFDAYVPKLERELAAIVRIATGRYPNLQQVFVSPRTYGGYATTQLNPEPYAYETGFADQWLVAQSVSQPSARPWVGWGPYLWTDGTRSGQPLSWTCQDVQPGDGTHPSVSGQQKVAVMLGDFFDTSEFATWYRAPAPQTSSRPVARWPLSQPLLIAVLVLVGLTVGVATFALGIHRLR